MRNCLASVCFIATALLLAPAASAQSKRGNKAAAAAPAPKAAKAAAPGKKGAKPAAREVSMDDGDVPSGPVVAGAPSDTATRAKEEFERARKAESNRDLWRKAAVDLKAVVSGSEDDEGNKQHAAFMLAQAYYYLGYYQASYALLSKIADNKDHLEFTDALPWLAQLATQLPESVDVVERIGKYDADQLSRFEKKEEQKPVYWQLNYLLGRFKYRNKDYEEAIRLFEKVSDESRYFAQAQFFSGISNVQLRKSVPAVQAFQKIIDTVDSGSAKFEEGARMKDLAYLSMARTYYSASVKLDDNNVPTVNEEKLSAAVANWNHIDASSEYWLDGLFEQSWAYFMAGDYPHALGNIHTLDAPYFPNSFYPEADVLKAVISFTICQYEDATTHVARMKRKYDPIKKELQSTLQRFEGESSDEESYRFLTDVRAGKAKLSEPARRIVEAALSDRQLLRLLEYVRLLEEQQKAFGKESSDFRSSAAGEEVSASIESSRTSAMRSAGALARERFQRNLDELNDHLMNAQKILIDIDSAARTQLDQEAAGAEASEGTSVVYGVVEPDKEHVLWPFDGEYWRDELGFYRQVATSKCGK